MCPKSKLFGDTGRHWCTALRLTSFIGRLISLLHILAHCSTRERGDRGRMEIVKRQMTRRQAYLNSDKTRQNSDCSFSKDPSLTCLPAPSPCSMFRTLRASQPWPLTFKIAILGYVFVVHKLHGAHTCVGHRATGGGAVPGRLSEYAGSYSLL